MKLTGLYYLDDAFDRHPLFSVSHRSPIQSCCTISVDMTSQEVCRALAVKDLSDPSYCIRQAIKRYRQDHVVDTDAPFLRLHRINLPNGNPLLWVLLDDEGNALEEVFCKHRGRFPDYCRAIIRYLQHMTKQKTVRQVA